MPVSVGLIGSVPMKWCGPWILLCVCALGAVAEAEEATPGKAESEEQTEEQTEEASQVLEGVSDLHSLRYHYANDTFTSTDYYFTQGMGLVWISPFLAESPLAIPLPKLGEGSLRQVSLRWRYDGFTPLEIDRREIQLEDRPFASYMYLGHRSESLAAGGEGGLWAQWSLGYLGPAVGAKQFQAEIHRGIDGKEPRGWRNQIKGDLVAQLEVGGSYRLLRYEALLDLQVEFELRGGTLYSDGTAGARLRFGLLGAPLGPPDPDWRFYFWLSGHVRGVGYNATLEGGVFRKSSDYTLPATDVKRLVGIARGGLELEVGSFGISYSLTFISPEFSGGRSHAWGELGFTAFF